MQHSTATGGAKLVTNYQPTTTVDGWMDGRMDRWMDWFVFVFVIFVSLGKRCCVRVKKKLSPQITKVYIFYAVELQIN